MIIVTSISAYKRRGSIIYSNNNRDLVIDPGDRVNTNAQFTLAAMEMGYFQPFLRQNS